METFFQLHFCVEVNLGSGTVAVVAGMVHTSPPSSTLTNNPKSLMHTISSIQTVGIGGQAFWSRRIRVKFNKKCIIKEIECVCRYRQLTCTCTSTDDNLTKLARNVHWLTLRYASSVATRSWNIYIHLYIGLYSIIAVISPSRPAFCPNPIDPAENYHIILRNLALSGPFHIPLKWKWWLLKRH